MDPTSSCRRRHKSFAGCWTCRARKVKCDEARPNCVQCGLKGLSCEGYEVRLRWMPPEAGSHGYEHKAEEDMDAVQQRSQRSLVACDAAEAPLQLSELDDIFSQIDSFQPLEDHLHEKQLFLFNFGVFNPASKAPYDGTLPVYATEGPADTSSLSSNSFIDAWGPESSSSLQDYVTDEHSSGFSLTGFGALLHAHETTANITSNQGDGALALVASPATSLTEPPAYEYCGSQHRQDNHALWWKDSYSDAIIYNPSPLPLPTLERFLLNHYVHRVVHLFCVISYEKSPWKTIHLPRVLQSVGQLSLHGSTSKVRDALRNALLSISAFYLANDQRSDDVEKWEEYAVNFRGRAIKLLKETVEGGRPEKRPKYKEMLATMLSMITINVMSGDTSTCGIHLDGAFRFMNHIKASKSKYSSKARSLHRIYFYLRVIYDSTACQASKSSDAPPSPEADFGTALSVSLLDKTDEDNGNDGTCPGISVLNHVAAPKAQVGEYECVYGVPQSLLILLARTTELIDQVTASRQSSNSLASDVSDKCDALESDIIDWKAFSSSNIGSDSTPSSLIIQKTTLAFHSALIIYFAQHIRSLHHTYLHAHILKVLSSIEAIEDIKSEKNILSAPLYWPAFIAGSEAFEDSLQDRFRKWYVQVEGYRLASVRSGIDVLRDVWKRGPGGRGTSVWRRVVQETGAKLMLS